MNDAGRMFARPVIVRRNMNTDTSPGHRMKKLARTFPSLCRVFDDLHPWDADKLERWARKASHGEQVSAQFILAVWDPSHEWQCGRFDAMEALRVWDEEHRAAFLSWAANPWWT